MSIANCDSLVMQRTMLCVGILLFCLIAEPCEGRTLEVGPGRAYVDPTQATTDARPGDTILIFPGTYNGTFFITGLRGTADSNIVIRGTDRVNVEFRGGTEALHLTNCHYVSLENFTVTGQTGNGINVDDGGSITVPTTHISFRNITFTDMDATGNNDLLKLSGLDSFLVEKCLFQYGALGGSGIDMVGCHYGVIQQNWFHELGSNCIQAKGGTHHISINRNMVTRGGQRAFNIGGSTGLQFFRPANATFEAADIVVYSNVVVGSVTPVAFVGAVRVNVFNNTFVNPEKWGFRILQETVDETRFEKCGNNIFQNNIVWYGDEVGTMVNVGSNTSPESFLVTNNLFYRHTNPSNSSWSVPGVTQAASIIGLNPMFIDTSNGNYRLQGTSPAIGAGASLDNSYSDFAGNEFRPSPSVGAFEGDIPQSAEEYQAPYLNLYPNPSFGRLTVEFEDSPYSVEVYSLNGKPLVSTMCEQRNCQVPTDSLPTGVYVLRLTTANKSLVRIFAVQ